MTLPTWSNLEKSQIDSETIEEAIARLIAVHEADGNAHTGAGKSLNTHKTQSTVDHPAGSIVEDKLADLNITAKKMNVNTQYAQIQLESLDAFNQILTGTGAAIYLEGIGTVSFSPGDEVGSVAILNTVNPIIASKSAKDPWIQILVTDGGDEANDIGFSFGLQNPFDEDNGGFGIEYIVDDDKIYGFYNTFYDAAWHRERVELAIGAPYEKIWRAELNHTDKTIKFYINNALVKTMDISGYYYEQEDDFYLAFGAKKNEICNDCAVWFMNPISNQNI